MGSSPSSMESRLVAVRGSPTMTHGPATDSGLSEGKARPNRSNWAPTPFSARRGRARSSESRYV